MRDIILRPTSIGVGAQREKPAMPGQVPHLKRSDRWARAYD